MPGTYGVSDRTDRAGDEAEKIKEAETLRSSFWQKRTGPGGLPTAATSAGGQRPYQFPLLWKTNAVTMVPLDPSSHGRLNALSPANAPEKKGG